MEWRREVDLADEDSKAGRYHHGNLREALLAAAVAHIGADGLDSLSLRGLARRLGVSSAAPYRHFPSRQALLAAVAAEGFRALGARIGEAMREHPEAPATALQEGGVAYVRFAYEHAAHYGVMFSAELVDKTAYPELVAAAGEAFGQLIEGIEACQAAGAIRPGDTRPLALSAWSSVHGLASLLSTGQVAILQLSERSPDELARLVSRRLISGLGP